MSYICTFVSTKSVLRSKTRPVCSKVELRSRYTPVKDNLMISIASKGIKNVYSL